MEMNEWMVVWMNHGLMNGIIEEWLNKWNVNDQMKVKWMIEWKKSEWLNEWKVNNWMNEKWMIKWM